MTFSKQTLFLKLAVGLAPNDSCRAGTVSVLFSVALIRTMDVKSLTWTIIIRDQPNVKLLENSLIQAAILLYKLKANHPRVD